MLNFKIIFGVVPGYQFEGDDTITLEDVSQNIVSYLNTVKESGDVIPTGTLVESRTLYPTAFRCPVDGEKTFIFSGCQNPEFVKDEGLYKEAVEKLAEWIASKFKQSTVTLQYWKSDLKYIKSEGEDELN